ncbi:unnamed protein product [Gongylonema pulchrum]|uniref:Uncharacterized protein n=1 Tax=Gongylonema pulchrum TaxID=637853 RepID=A0A183DF99_9BILA|nr:unnamed protein product [Gongylonema pulchrum]
MSSSIPPPVVPNTKSESPPDSPQYVIPITPNLPKSPPDFNGTRSFDHNDPKYQCCCRHMHITVRFSVFLPLNYSKYLKILINNRQLVIETSYVAQTLAARVVSVAYLCGAVLNVFLAIATQGTTLAFYSVASFAFALAIFGTLIYGIFKEKRPFILPYMIFQVNLLSALCDNFTESQFFV